jgi:uncharacterized protein YndB with AHSA1/START domain
VVSASIGGVTVTRMRQIIHAPRDRVYNALIDPAAVARWRVPAEMTSEVHEFDARRRRTSGWGVSLS